MAENVHFKYPNFCLGPQDGTFCSINQDDVNTIMRIKTSAGSLISDYSLSSNIVNELIHLEYVGPSNLTTIVDDLTFFTIEKVSSTKCIIKRWETRPSSVQLNLKSQIIKYTTGLYYYDLRSAAVEHYERTFSLHNPGGINYIDLNSTSRITTGMELFLGPSNDADNEGATESVIVNFVAGSKVYLTSNLTYQYVIGDQVSFYNNVYLISNLGIGGDTSKGTIFKINADNGTIVESNTDKVYQSVDSSRWCTLSETVASICDDNMLFINPYASYYNWRSMYLNNLEDDDKSNFTIQDVVFEDYSVYLLADRRTVRDDDGNKTTENWSGWYNYIQNTLLPYSNNIEIYTDNSTMIGQSNTITLYVKVIDQYGVGLKDVNVVVDIDSGDLGAVLDPLSGQVTTDSNGEASVDYTSGTSYEGMTIITCRADGSSSYTGSQYIWNSMKIRSYIEYIANDDAGDNKYYLVYTVTSGIDSYINVRDKVTEMTSENSMFTKSFFTQPGGDWSQNYTHESEISSFLPGLITGSGESPRYSFGAPDHIVNPNDFNPMPNNIRQVEEFESELQARQLKNFKCLTEYDGGGFTYEEPYFIIQQIIESFDLQLSQLKTSAHTHWVGATAYDYLWTDVTLDQFIFVEDAIPVFWSEKNSIDTNIWLRLRPFAYSLNGSTLKFFVKEVWWDGDTGYVDVTSQVSLQYFDAGGGVLGLEITYDPAQDFHHNAVVYVFLEIYDTAPAPNRITTNYWFGVIPDYKSPYLDNLNPSREQSEVNVDTDVYFEIKDLGAGIDIDSLEMTINSRRVVPTSIIRVSNYHYKVTYNPTDNFFFGKRITVGVKVKDVSEFENWLNDRYAFYTAESDDILFTKFDPGLCKKGLSRFTDVSFVALGTGAGVDVSTLRLQVRERDVTDESTIVPVIYRIS